MRTLPKPFVLMSLALVLVALCYPVQVMFIYGHSLTELVSIFSKLAPLNWVVILGCTWVSSLSYRGSRWTLAMFPLLTIAVAWNNWLVSQVGSDFGVINTSLATLGFASLGGFMFTAASWEVITHPEKRWWLRPERRAVAAPVFVIPKTGDAFRVETFDISRTGAFLKVRSGDALMRTGDRISLRLTMGALTVLRCEAKVVRKSDAKGMYPDGVGIEFLNLKGHETAELKKYLDSQPSL
jgi:hypothetical protein